METIVISQKHKNYSTKILTCLAFLYLLTTHQNGLINAQTLSKNQIKEDLVFLKKQMEKYHAGLHIYNPNFEAKSDSLLNTVLDDESLLNTFKYISQLTALGREGHYNVGEWTDPVHIGFSENRYKYFPLNTFVLDDHIYVNENYSNDSTLKSGDEILAINNVPVGQILQALYRYISADGHIRSNRNYKITQGFNWMYYLFIEQPDVFKIDYIPYKSEKRDAVFIDALTRQQMVVNYSKLKKSDDDPTPTAPSIKDVYSYELRDSIAFLTLKSFDWKLIEKYKLDASELYASIFKDIFEKNVQFLVVDLRNNTGGRYEFANAILPFILQKNTQNLYKTSISWKGKKKRYKLPSKSKYAFHGKTFILVNANTFSAGASLARYLFEYADAVAIGEETGSRYEGYVAGSKQFVMLPNTKIKIGIPRYQTDFPPSTRQKTQNRGLIPDYLIEYKLDDLLNKTDKEIMVLNKLLQDK